MAISSIHIQAASSHCYAHNDRTEKVTYLVDDSSKNECNRSGKQAKSLLASFVKDAEKYRKDNGLRAIKSDTVKTVEAVVNLNAHHALADVEKLAKSIEQEFGFRAVQIAIHRDEGKSKQDKNYHAHIVMCNLTSEGKTILRAIGKDGLRKLQDITAQTLGMERGDPERKAPRLSAREYKKHAQTQDAHIQELIKAREELRLEKIKHEETLQKLLKSQNEAQGYLGMAQALKIENKALSDENTAIKAELAELKAMYDEDRAKLKASGTATQKDYQELKKAHDDLKTERVGIDKCLKELNLDKPMPERKRLA